jgi:hypothetical protein
MTLAVLSSFILLGRTYFETYDFIPRLYTCLDLFLRLSFQH